MNKASILLVDDTPANLVALEAILEGLGHNLVKANSGEAALKCLLQQEFAVILLDVRMPGMDGFETAKLIRAREQLRHTPIIFITAISSSDTQIFKGYFLGAADYLVKPIVPEILRAKVEAFVTLFRRAQEMAERERLEAEHARHLIREQEARRLAEEANQMKDQFLAITSHELRTPLTALLGWARLLSSGKLDEATHDRALEMIERNVKAQARLIDDLLDVSRIITGKFDVHPQTIELKPILVEAVEMVRPAAQAKAIQLQLDMAAGEAKVSADASRLQQAINNILSNAIKFTPQGGRIDVRFTQVDSQVEIIVSDTGKGISAEFLPNIFDRFRQAGEQGGLGLGLAIVRHIIEQHGGTVRAESLGEDKGSTFTITLPLKADQEPAGETSVAPTAASLPSLTGVKLLVMDDQADSQELLAPMLRQTGAEVLRAKSAAEALDTFRQARPDVLVCNLAITGDDGHELIRKIRALAPEQGGQIPAIALTGHITEEHRQQIISSGFQIHLTKPGEADTLAFVIATLLGRA